MRNGETGRSICAGLKRGGTSGKGEMGMGSNGNLPQSHELLQTVSMRVNHSWLVLIELLVPSLKQVTGTVMVIYECCFGYIYSSLVCSMALQGSLIATGEARYAAEGSLRPWLFTWSSGMITDWRADP